MLTAADEYLKFNDESVTRVDKSEVLGDMTGSNANPYLLVYVKKDQGMIRTYMRTADSAQQQTGHEQGAVVSTSTDASTHSTQEILKTTAVDSVGQRGERA